MAGAWYHQRGRDYSMPNRPRALSAVRTPGDFSDRPNSVLAIGIFYEGHPGRSRGCAMRFRFLILAHLLVVAAMSSASADERANATFEVEYFFHKVYPGLHGPKAIAIGLDGSFGASWNQP